MTQCKVKPEHADSEDDNESENNTKKEKMFQSRATKGPVFALSRMSIKDLAVNVRLSGLRLAWCSMLAKPPPK